MPQISDFGFYLVVHHVWSLRSHVGEHGQQIDLAVLFC
jgi:hypothetical protein